VRTNGAREESNRVLAVGDRVPSFSALDDSGAMRRSEDLIGQPLVLYFYPKDDTPG